MSAPDAGEQAAGINRQDQARSDRMLARLVRDPKASPSARIEAAQEQQKRRDTPGYVNGRGIGNVEQSRNQDRSTADKTVQAGLAAEVARKKMIASQIEGQAGKFPPSSSQVPVPRGASSPTGGPGIAPPTTDEYGFVSAPTAPAGQGATTPSPTLPVVQQAPSNVTPDAPDWRQQRAAALEALKGKFTKQDAANALAEKAAPQGIDPKYQVPKETLDMESKFDAMIADRPADQKAMFSKMSESDKAAMVQKNESLKTAREEPSPEVASLFKSHQKSSGRLSDIESRESAFFA